MNCFYTVLFAIVLVSLVESRFNHWSNRAKENQESPVVNTKTGRLAGKSAQTFSGVAYYQFLGVPFATPPVNELRFEPPKPFSWKGDWNATYERETCAQLNPANDFSPTSEDCLYMNIYAPSSLESSKSPLPVMVWIHGGEFMGGDGHYNSYPPDGFINNGVLVVSVTYRTGVFGFLSTADDVVPGNMGFKDILMALRWIKENIKNFGGDPSKVTIMGQDAGAVAVTYLIQSPTTKGLFQRAIIHSGTSLSPWSLSRVAKESIHVVGLKYPIVNNTKEVVKKLKEERTSILLIMYIVTMSNIAYMDPLNGLPYYPVREVSNPTQFFSANSHEQLRTCKFNPVPIIIGYTSSETHGVTYATGMMKTFLGRTSVSSDSLVPADMNIKNDTIRHELGNQIKQFYFNDDSIAYSPLKVWKYLADNEFVKPSVEYQKLYSNCKQPVYAYRFSYTKNKDRGVGHGEDLPYFFYNKEFKDEKDRDVSSNVMQLWSNFIKTGKPTSNNVKTTWSPSTKDNDYSYLDIGDQFSTQTQRNNPDRKYLEKWYQWYKTYGTEPYDTY